MTDDDQLMIGIQNDAPRAFEELVNRHQGPLIAFFQRNTRDPPLAEDLAQETLLRVYRQAWDYLPQGRFKSWMFRIARNLLIDTARRQSHDALIKAVRGREQADADALSRLAGDMFSPDEQADQRELARMVDELLAELPEDQRLTFTLHHFAGLPLPEVADVLETNLATTKSRLRLAREKLREKLRSRGVRDPGERED